MLQKSHMTEQVIQNCIYNHHLHAPLFKTTHLLFQGENVGTEPVAEAERSAQQGKMAIHY